MYHLTIGTWRVSVALARESLSGGIASLNRCHASLVDQHGPELLAVGPWLTASSPRGKFNTFDSWVYQGAEQRRRCSAGRWSNPCRRVHTTPARGRLPASMGIVRSVNKTQEKVVERGPRRGSLKPGYVGPAGGPGLGAQREQNEISKSCIPPGPRGACAAGHESKSARRGVLKAGYAGPAGGPGPGARCQAKKKVQVPYTTRSTRCLRRGT